jgi:hypothetical protein
LGCNPPANNNYCPDGNVTRLAMAACMNRLGTALTPVFLRKREDSTGQNFSADPVAPSATGYLVSGFPRTAIVTGLLNAFTLDVGGMGLEAKLVYSTDNGTTWLPSPANDGFAYGSLYATFTPPGDISLRPHSTPSSICRSGSPIASPSRAFARRRRAAARLRRRTASCTCRSSIATAHRRRSMSLRSNRRGRTGY